MLDTIDNMINKKMLIRRLALVFMFALTAYAYKWSFDFAMISPRSGIDIAAIFAALLTPLTTLQGFIFKFYNEARGSKSVESRVVPKE